MKSQKSTLKIQKNSLETINNTVYLFNGLATITNFKTTFQQKIDFEGEKIVNIEDFLNFGANDSISLNIDSKDFKNILKDRDFKPLYTYNFNTIDTKNLIESINYAGKDDLRYVMMGAYLNKCDLIATDAHILIKRKLTNQIDKSVIIPSHVIKLIKQSKIKTFVLSYDGKKMKIEGNSCIIWGSHIEGKYPNYEFVIPKNNNNETVFNKKVLLNALKSLLTLTSKNTNKIIFDISKNKVDLIVNNDKGDLIKSIEIAAVKINDPIKIGFNAKFVIQACKTEQSKNINMFTSESNRGVMFNDVLVMPIIL